MKLFRDSEKAKYLASRLPSNWPSHLHNKCTVPTCYFPNAPQAADGTFNCLGNWDGTPCKGTYYVSSSTARAVMEDYRNRMRQEDHAKWYAHQTAAEIRRQKSVKRQMDEEARQLAADELAAKYEEERRIKEGITGDHHLSSSFLARRAAQRRRPTDTNPTNHSTEQQQQASSTYNQVPYLALYPTVVNNCYKPPVHQHPSHNTSRHRPTETRTYDYHHGKSPSKF